VEEILTRKIFRINFYVARDILSRTVPDFREFLKLKDLNMLNTGLQSATAKMFYILGVL